MSSRTIVTILDSELWKWAKIRSIEMDFENISQYIFWLIKQDKEHKESKEGK